MKYSYDFQFLPKGLGRPSDEGAVVPVETDEKGFLLAPLVGDYVQILKGVGNEDHAVFDGRVKSRLFTYVGTTNCIVNIVVEEVDASVWPSLIKE
ncbi:hypothetical protein G6L37_13720 [Agrobacterium rubi]|uniref:hypothetical protein n=1 Tax=Agrobacterium rubi TaxID=28099 RepID=UPI001572F20F|nr:hypothetical protein [Agrobacterium rubi]NTF07205.1 hypothetical protein [Agrobacterium rubi]NTF19461.1 hypothetical protein [Agrobacterium rubi]NTF26424.1 hypothetical protein [Agrobacterium rubi]